MEYLNIFRRYWLNFSSSDDSFGAKRQIFYKNISSWLELYLITFDRKVFYVNLRIKPV